MKDKNKKVVDIYNKIAELYAKNYDTIDGEADMMFPKTFLSYLHSKSSVLDVGCGTGFSAGWFVKNGMNVEGVDMSSSMIKIAKKNYPEINFYLADMRTFKPKKNPDAVWAGYSLFHLKLKDFERTLRTITSYLQKGGIFGLVMQEGTGEVEIVEPLLPEKNIYIHLYTVDELSGILNKNGFKVLEHKIRKPIYPNEFNFNKILLITERL